MSFSQTFETDEPARAAIDGSHGPLLLEFGTDWCPHCRRVQPWLADALSMRPEVRHVKIMDGPGRPLGRAYHVKLWPTLVFLRNGMEVERCVRPTAPDTINAALASLASQP